LRRGEGGAGASPGAQRMMPVEHRRVRLRSTRTQYTASGSLNGSEQPAQRLRELRDAGAEGVALFGVHIAVLLIGAPLALYGILVPREPRHLGVEVSDLSI